MKIRNIFAKLGTVSLCLALLVSCGAGDDQQGDGGGGFLGGIFDSDKNYTVLTDSQIGEEDGFSYELWKDYGDTEMTLKDDGCFSCEWSNINNALFRRGRKFDCTETYRDIGNIKVEYKADYQPDGNSYLCLYGWTRDPLIEYYIVDCWGSWRPPGGDPIATIEVDGAKYDVYRTLRVNQPSIDGNTTFEQYWSVRQEKRTEGTINAASHFAAWEALGMTMGKMYEAALTVEGYQSAGKADISKNEFTLGGDIPDAVLPELPEPEKADENGYYFYADFEDGDSGWGSRGDAQVKITDEAAADGTKAMKITNRRDSWQGAQHELNSRTYIAGETYTFSAKLMQSVSDSVTFKLTVQYNSASGTQYEGIAEATAEKGEWIQLSGDYKIPQGAWGTIIYVETTSGTVDFYLDDATGAVQGVCPEWEAPAAETDDAAA